MWCSADTAVVLVVSPYEQTLSVRSQTGRLSHASCAKARGFYASNVKTSLFITRIAAGPGAQLLTASLYPGVLSVAE